MQKFVLFIEPVQAAWSTSSKIGNLFLNRFSIDEDAHFEILKICHLDNTSLEFSGGVLTKAEGPDLWKAIQETVVSNEICII